MVLGHLVLCLGKCHVHQDVGVFIGKGREEGHRVRQLDDQV